ncbi:acetate CoA/acetoacetate CoA-transferase alpha subunit [Bacilli bacterium PM5-3]|nr:acetate CoA/acetoacetate CoA-transferase alpha subunit [Bacilli bacterium PM5-3]MDH6603661.1 acetate CoA/acetoacetate CoA-transferase alpha subunit [Bacilli bacterium PM5-9]
MKTKVVSKESLKDHLHDGMSIMVGGFMACGTPETIVDMIIESGIKDLTMYCNDAGFPDRGIGRIIAKGQCKKLYTSHIGLNPEAQAMMNDGRMEIVLVPQGTLAEQIRAGGSGLGGVLTPTGLGTLVEEGKQVLEIKGKKYLLEEAFKADLSIVKANVADTVGNSRLLGTTLNFNPLMALAGEKVMVEADEIVEHINQDDVTIPHVVVDYVIKEEH